MLSQKATVAVLRQALVAILVLGLVGTEIELLFLKHTDGVWQLVPVSLAGLALAVLAWYGIGRSGASVRALQGVMLLCLVSGGIGVVQHLRGNLRDAHESNPSLSGTELYIEALMGATPALAPGTMVQLALVGLAFAFRHPSLRGPDREDDIPSQRNEA